jgi:hypothetical protein
LEYKLLETPRPKAESNGVLTGNPVNGEANNECKNLANSAENASVISVSVKVDEDDVNEESPPGHSSGEAFGGGENGNDGPILPFEPLPVDDGRDAEIAEKFNGQAELENGGSDHHTDSHSDDNDASIKTFSTVNEFGTNGGAEGHESKPVEPSLPEKVEEPTGINGDVS